jgi:hypothetical protein
MRESTPPNEKVLRLRYIRVLEKFLTRAVSLLKNEDFNAQIFKKNVDKYYKEILKVKAVRLDSEYLNMLEAFVNNTLAKTNTTDDDFTEQRTSLLKEVNILAKEKNKATYKKDKHKDRDFYDGY